MLSHIAKTYKSDIYFMHLSLILYDQIQYDPALYTIPSNKIVLGKKIITI